ncbi:hypothetical protein AAC387_Pa12g0587 [Persea americana]
MDGKPSSLFSRISFSVSTWNATAIAAAAPSLHFFSSFVAPKAKSRVLIVKQTPATSFPSSPLSFGAIFAEIHSGQPLYPFAFRFLDSLQGIPAHSRSLRSGFLEALGPKAVVYDMLHPWCFK